jgi:hypothetical protein
VEEILYNLDTNECFVMQVSVTDFDREKARLQARIEELTIQLVASESTVSDLNVSKAELV